MSGVGAVEKTIDDSHPVMNALEAIYSRRSVRSYKSQVVTREQINSLLAAAVQAPTAIHEEPWVFAVIQNRDLLKQISDDAKKYIDPETHGQLFTHFVDPAFNIFYDAGTLIVIYGKPLGSFVTADCWLAAENLMLAAYAMGLGTCVMGLAVEVLNTTEWKEKLGVSADLTAYAPIIVGAPAGSTPPVSRKVPQIISWK